MYLKGFWRYYGSKCRAAVHYPKPKYNTIVEPFAGAAGYSLQYPDHDIILIEKYPIVAEIWRYLIGVSSAEILKIPLVESTNDLPTRIPQGAKYLVGFAMNDASVSPRITLSAGLKRARATGRLLNGWSEEKRARVASQVEHIKHWKIIEGDYTTAPDIEATWFIDPPYNNKAGSYYVHSELDYSSLARWCLNRHGHLIVCENEGADWLPFKSFKTFRAGMNGHGSKEMIFTGVRLRE